jgi:Protein of unknown function, DUF547
LLRAGYHLLASLLVLGMLCIVCPVQAHASRILNDAVITRPFHHTIWQATMTRTVTASGAVDFITLRMHPGRLNQYLEQLAMVSPENHPDYFPHPADVLAYWLNAYNALALKLALNRYPLTASQAELVHDFETPSRYVIGNKPYTLKVLRERLMNRYYSFYPQILMALTDYTMDGPPLFPQAYESATLNQQLDAAMQLTLKEGRLMQFKRPPKTDPTACPSIELSAYWKGYEQLWSDEPSDAIVNGSASVRVWPVTKVKIKLKTASWFIRLKPFAPADFAANWDKPCSPTVQYRPANLQWRQVNFI